MTLFRNFISTLLFNVSVCAFLGVAWFLSTDPALALVANGRLTDLGCYVFVAAMMLAIFIAAMLAPKEN